MAAKRSPGVAIKIAHANTNDLTAIKRIADQHKYELGFVLKAALLEAIEEKRIFIAKRDNKHQVLGFLHYRHKRDGTTKIYQICVVPQCRGGQVGNKLVNALGDEARKLGQEAIVLSCPQDLPANIFYNRYGFRLAKTTRGKQRALCLWTYYIA